MRYAKILGLLAGATAAMLAFAVTASADTLTRAGDDTPTVQLVSEEDVVGSATHVLLHNSIANILCNVEIKPHTDSHNASHTEGEVTSLVFSSCTNGWVVHSNAAGDLTLEVLNTTEATVFWSGMTITATRFGISCRYVTVNTHIGTLTEGSRATLELEGTLPFHSGSPLCGTSSAAWTGSFETTHELLVDP